VHLDYFLIGYIDPGSGTILLQALMAGILGIIWRVTSHFKRGRSSESVPSEIAAKKADEPDLSR
jgi:hypothetical protein